MTILSCLHLQNIKLTSMRSKVAEELADEGDAAGAAIAQARNKFLTQANDKIIFILFKINNLTMTFFCIELAQYFRAKH